MQQAIALILVLICAPFMVLVMLFILLIDWQNPTFIQERIGINKEPFNIYKFRTMKNNRVTFLGKLLRRSGLDELPQLFNIALGDMKFVGPRPLTEFDITRLGWDGESHSVRWSVTPGITGPAQLINVCDSERSFACDVYYTENKSVGLDFQIFFRSLLVPILGKSKAKHLIGNSGL